MNWKSFIPALVAAIILAQTLYFKFTASPESVALFTALEVEPFGRIATGVFELICAVLLMIPSTRLYGGIMGVCLMAGAIASHLFVVGIESNGDGGLLFLLAVVVLVSSLLVVYFERLKLIALRQRIFARL